MAPHTYPDALYRPRPLARLGDLAIRKRLSGPALRAVFNIIKAWGIRDSEARALLGHVSIGTYYRLKAESKQNHIERTLSADMLTRISLVIGIYKALHILYRDEVPNTWMKMPNTNPIFSGERPVDHAIEGGIDALYTIRRLLDARRGLLA